MPFSIFWDSALASGLRRIRGREGGSKKIITRKNVEICSDLKICGKNMEIYMWET